MKRLLFVSLILSLLLLSASPYSLWMYHAGQNLELGESVYYLPSYATGYEGELYSVTYLGGCNAIYWTWKDDVLTYQLIVMASPSHLDETRERPGVLCWNGLLNFGSEAKVEIKP